MCQWKNGSHKVLIVQPILVMVFSAVEVVALFATMRNVVASTIFFNQSKRNAVMQKPLT